MKKNYNKPEADKISFNYRDQVVAASSDIGSSGSGSGDSVMENSIGIGSPICGSGGILDLLFDLFNSDTCN